MPKLSAIVFDLDDTLYPERSYVISGFEAVAQWCESHLGFSSQQTHAELVAMFEQGVRGDTFGKWLDRHQLDRQHEQKMVATYREHAPSIQPYPDAVDVLQNLAADYLLGIVSDGHLAVQQRKLRALGIEPWFQAVVFSDQFGREHWKPSTRPFLAVLEKLGVPASESAYVGDNPIKDFIAAKQLGMITVHIRREEGEYPQEPPSERHRADASIMRLEQLVDHLPH